MDVKLQAISTGYVVTSGSAHIGRRTRGIGVQDLGRGLERRAVWHVKFAVQPKDRFKSGVVWGIPMISETCENKTTYSVS